MENHARDFDPSDAAPTSTGSFTTMDRPVPPIQGHLANLEIIAAITNLQERVDHLEKATKSLQEKTDRLEEAANALHKTTGTFEETNKSLQETNKSLQETNNALRAINVGLHNEVQDLVQRALTAEKEIRTFATMVRFGRTAVEGLEKELKTMQDQVCVARNEHNIDHNNLREVTKQQEENTHQIKLLQRGTRCLEKILGLRRFRQVVNGDRGEANSSVLDQQQRKIGTMLAWFERMSLNEFKPEDIRWFFDDKKKKSSS
ncbi:hypothetical protein NEMBOFW57_008276 [Staphylotrichum longicolle]|uniref:Uncharacterized protein n=1 Tax=Staphylotrichum longicolle TaxID=669026 RepID=A0AAD4ERN4_9PEZI|nr:hypothetical protein NEMBOFW57_008276 [Staphylotrichum longicolle]